MTSFSRSDEDVAMLLPVGAGAGIEPRRPTTESDRAGLLASSGGWQGIVDGDEFIEADYESRRRSSRPPVNL